MEPAYVDHMKKVKGDKIWTIGPLVEFFRKDECQSDVSSSAGRHTCLSWLDNQKPKSVIYVCFGSIAILPKAHITQIALALEESKQPFIWVHRKQPCEQISPFPDGFEERIKKQNKGLIITSWVPQVEILQHPSILVFFSHCGWGSVLEAVVSGVPLVTYPLFADQLYLEKLVVEIIKEITVTNNLKEITKKAKQAVEEGGSSFNNLTALIEDLKALKFSQKT